MSFAVLAEPSRRQILDLLRVRERTVNELVERLRLSQPGVSKHLRVRREAGLVDVRVDAQRRWYQLRPDPPRLLEFTWGEDPLRSELTPEGDGCVLVFMQIFEGKAAAPRLAAGWTICLAGLDALLDGTAVESGDWFPLYQRYAKEFGDEPIVDGEGVVRVERVLPLAKADLERSLRSDAATQYRFIEAGDRTIVL